MLTKFYKLPMSSAMHLRYVCGFCLWRIPGSDCVQGIQAKTKDLKAVFGTEDHLKCCLFILEKGELQVSDKEREAQLDR